MDYHFFSGSWVSENGRDEDGEVIYRTVYYVFVSDTYGRVWAYVNGFDTNAEAAKVADSFQRRLYADWKPAEDYWCFHRYAYGSQGYMEHGCELELLEREMAEG